ncbi:sulfite exporter TauE/SafE family protein [Bdellovibrio sp. 22V]|uniref:sulfite exporter TauE/SafE family protein n=1 Tax=Bdellovibrio TaxID=958 RepID=UPI002543566E|nr:sulfite exporter TauE/SafE family protein [Bdellovibrio sp. 22V]WII73649.1 sulfite exporter TauE/SafE family protein [Bdellovibrio sp. 22V]
MTTATGLLVLGIISSSFFGSWHCAAMCGPIATLMKSRNHLLQYHLGRLSSYLLLGFLAGSLGEFFLNSDFVILRWISAGVLALLLCFYGIVMLAPRLQRTPAWTHAPLALLRRLQAFHVQRSGFIVGLFTAFLPCGWLYTYVAAAITTKSPWAGTLTLFLFWLGGLPALSAIPFMVRRTVQSAGLKQQKWAGIILVISGLYSLGSFMFLH